MKLKGSCKNTKLNRKEEDIRNGKKPEMSKRNFYQKSPKKKKEDVFYCKNFIVKSKKSKRVGKNMKEKFNKEKFREERSLKVLKKQTDFID